MSNLLHHPGGAAAVVGLVVCAWLIVFVVYWALIGWGVSIAVRTYRRAMRNHQPHLGTPALVERYPAWSND